MTPLRHTLHRHKARGAALLAAMLTVTLVATFAAAAMWQQWRAVEVETAERGHVQPDLVGLDELGHRGQVHRPRQLRHRLGECGLLADEAYAGSVSFASSEDTPDELALYREFFEMEL